MPRTGTPSGPDSLPSTIGRPVTRALVSAGITQLHQVCRLSERELRALHGVGPKAVRLLHAALEAQGLALRPG